MAYEEEEDIVGDESQGMVSPLQMLMMGYSTVTPEGKAKAAEVFGDLYGKRSAYDEQEDSAYQEYETQARAARETLRKAREVLAAKRTPSTRWLEMAKGFGSATRAGSFGESVANYADARIPGRQREAEWEANRDNQLLQFDQGMSGIDQSLAMNKLKMKQLRRGADDKLMIEAMKIMGKPVPGAGKRTPHQEVQGSLDKAYAKDYLTFIQGGASEAAKNIGELKRANQILASTDMVSGPIIGLVPKIMRDVFLPKSSETQESVESTVQKSLKEVLGNQFTAPEGERLLARVYNPRFEEKVNARRVQTVLDRLERAYTEKVRAAKYFETHGTLEGYKGKVTWKMDDFDPDIPQDDDPVAIAESLMGETRPAPRRPTAAPSPAAVAPDEGMDEIPIESLLPAQARGGLVGYAKGGKVKGAKKLTKKLQEAVEDLDFELGHSTAEIPDIDLRKSLSSQDWESPFYMWQESGARDVALQKNLEENLVAAGLSPAEAKKVGFEISGDFEIGSNNPNDAAAMYPVKLSGPKSLITRFKDYLYQEGLLDPPMEKHARGGRVRFAEGGPVEGDFQDGRPRFRMPDGKIIRARPGDDYNTVLQIYTTATGTAPTVPGLPPQQIPPREPAPGMGEEEEAALPPQVARPPMAAAAGPEQGPGGPPSFMQAAMSELPSSLAYAGAGAIGGGISDKILTSLSDRLPGRGETPAQRRVLDMLQEQRRSPADVVAGVRGQQKMGIPAMAMDDPALRATADNALPETGLQNSSIILQRLKDRAGGLEERVTEQVNQNLKPDDFFDKEKALLDDLYGNSKPLYEKAYVQYPAIKSKMLGALLDTPDGKKAVKIALRELRNEGKKIGKQDAMNMVTQPSLEFLDKVKQGLDRLITKEEGHGMNYKATSLGKSMRGLRDALRDEMDTATTTKGGNSLYKAAREQYAGDLEVLDALRTGRDDFGKLQPQQLNKLVNGLSFAEKDAFRTGVAQNLFEALQAPSTDVNSARRIIGSTAMQAKLRTLFDNDKQFELFKTALEKEAELHELDKKSIRRGEAGQELHAEPKDGPIKRGAKYVPRLGWKSPTMWALQFIRNNAQATEKKMDEVLEHLKASTPDELADLEKKLGPKYARRLSRKGRAAKTAVAGALAGAAYRVATGAEGEEDDDAEQE